MEFNPRPFALFVNKSSLYFIQLYKWRLLRNCYFCLTKIGPHLDLAGQLLYVHVWCLCYFIFGALNSYLISLWIRKLPFGAYFCIDKCKCRFSLWYCFLFEAESVSKVRKRSLKGGWNEKVTFKIICQCSWQSPNEASVDVKDIFFHGYSVEIFFQC